MEKIKVVGEVKARYNDEIVVIPHGYYDIDISGTVKLHKGEDLYIMMLSQYQQALFVGAINADLILCNFRVLEQKEKEQVVRERFGSENMEAIVDELDKSNPVVSIEKNYYILD